MLSTPFSPYGFRSAFVSWQFHLWSKTCGITTGKLWQKVIKADNSLLGCQTFTLSVFGCLLRYGKTWKTSIFMNEKNVYGVALNQDYQDRNSKNNSYLERTVIVTSCLKFIWEYSNSYVFVKQAAVLYSWYLMHFENNLISRKHSRFQKINTKTFSDDQNVCEN